SVYDSYYVHTPLAIYTSYHCSVLTVCVHTPLLLCPGCVYTSSPLSWLCVHLFCSALSWLCVHLFCSVLAVCTPLLLCPGCVYTSSALSWLCVHLFCSVLAVCTPLLLCPGCVYTSSALLCPGCVYTSSALLCPGCVYTSSALLCPGCVYTSSALLCPGCVYTSSALLCPGCVYTSSALLCPGCVYTSSALLCSVLAVCTPLLLCSALSWLCVHLFCSALLCPGCVYTSSALLCSVLAVCTPLLLCSALSWLCVHLFCSALLCSVLAVCTPLLFCSVLAVCTPLLPGRLVLYFFVLLQDRLQDIWILAAKNHYPTQNCAMELSRKSLRKLNKKSEQYPIAIHFYQNPPTENISLIEFETLAIDRLKLLKVIENVGVRYIKSHDEYRNQLETEIKKLKFPYRYGQEEATDASYELQRKDHISHFILRLAYCQSEDLRRWFIQQEMDLFRFRFNQLLKDKIPEFLKLNDLEYVQVSIEEKLKLQEDLRNSSNITTTAFEECEFYKVPFQAALDLVRPRKVFLSKGFAYIPQRDIISIILNDFRAKLSKALAERENWSSVA
uniref:DNA primase large subunit n=1 Tax=Leptobrachium leishanense TaxID=445787 RepID=A0A8C5PLU9_9ANUR